VFVWLFRLDTQKEEEQIVRISRDETLSRLPLRMQSGRIVELVQLRDSSRPVRKSENLRTDRRCTPSLALQLGERGQGPEAV